jgi:carotenoid cleavage dioxygenase-like enzyme
MVGILTLQTDGEFVRNGPNPAMSPTGGYHWFDGDGMLHGIRIQNGTVSYINRWTRTRRLADEQRLGRPVYTKIGDLEGKLGLAKIMLGAARQLLKCELVKHVPLDEGTANTSVAFHNGQLMALVENSVGHHQSSWC